MNIITNLFRFRKRLQPLVPITKKCSHFFLTADDLAYKTTNRNYFGITVLILLLTFSANLTRAQTPTYALTGGTSANSWPFNAATGGSNKVQWLYYPSNFATAPAGMITKVYFRTSSSGTFNFTDLNIKMGYTTNTTFPSGTYITGLTTVFSATGATSITIPSNGWLGITLTTPFFYTAGQNFIVEASHNGSATGITVMQNNSTPNGRIYGNVTSTTGTATTGLTDFGFDLLPGPPCATPGAPSASGITSTTATLTWTPASPSVSYNYLISTSATPPGTGFLTTTGTTVNATGLLPGTTYYLHVRNNCTSTNWSQWVTYQFKTNPPCSARTLSIKNITADAADISWRDETHALQYEYVLKLNKTVPSTNGNFTTDTAFNIDQLAEGTTYYVFVRMFCPGGEISDWALDSFTTRTICRAPNLMIDHISSNRAVVYWDAMPTALAYEYEISQSPTPLGKGTEIEQTSFYAFPLKDGQVYYFHVKSKCVDQGFVSESEWTTTSFITFPTSIADTKKYALAISLHPNPVKKDVTIDIKGKIGANAQIIVTNLSGQILYTSEVKQNTTPVDMSRFPSGIYMMRYSDENHSETHRLIKD